MTKFVRLTAAVAALTLAATPAFAAPVQPDKQATATARVIKPLTLTWVQDLDLGSITLVNSGATTVGITHAGVFSCPVGDVTCSGTPQVAKYNVTGVNNQVVTINSGNVSLVNQTDPTKTLLLTVSSPGTVTLANSGAPGTDFSLGGSVTVDGTTTEGTYQGTFAVTVNY
jgi:hypothetical protein